VNLNLQQDGCRLNVVFTFRYWFVEIKTQTAVYE